MPEQSWSLVTVRHGLEEEAAVRRADGAVVRLPPELRARGLMELMEPWERVEARLRGWEPQGELIDAAQLLAPLRFPRKLICVGANYADHVREMGEEPPAVPAPPFFFLLPPTTTLIADREPILMSPDPAWRVDWEAELAIVIGRRGRRIAPEDALGHVAGFSVLNDVSARGLHQRPDAPAPPFAFDWLGAKGVDTFCPMGPGVTPAWLIEDPQALAIRCWINGELKQNGTTAEMLVDLPMLIAAISALITLEPGDVISTGTPAGVGTARGEQLHDGDLVTIEIEGVGRISNPVVADSSMAYTRLPAPTLEEGR